MSKIKKPSEILDLIKDGDTVFIGGFLHVGGPDKLIMYLLNNKELKDLTIVANDTGFQDKPGISQLVVRKCCKKVITSHIGTNRETGRQMNANETEVDLVPQGTLAEQIRSGGYGLGGVLTPTGVGIAEIEEGREKITVEGKEYLLFPPLKADVALLNAYRVDKAGNMEFRGSTRNFNQSMAYAAKTVIVEADNIVDGYIGPEKVQVPGILVDAIIDGSKLNLDGKEVK